MSLSAHIALAPSRGIARLERAMALGGVAVAAAFAVARWPSASGLVVATAVAAGGALLAVRRRRAVDLTIVVGDHASVGVKSSRADLPTDGWRLDESTVSWPSFGVVALRDDDGRTILHPVAMTALPPRDRWALARFLRWSMRRPADERPVV